MAIAQSRISNWLARLWPKHLTLGFGVAVCAAVLITEVIFLIPAAYIWHKGNEIKAVEEVRLAWYHSSSPAAFLTVQQKVRIGERLMRDGLLLGGVVYDSSGEPLAVFGERPLLDLNIARLSGIDTQLSPTTPALDAHFSPEQIEMSHHIIVRLPTQPIEQATYRQLRNFGLSVLFIAGLTAVLFILASLVLVIAPLRAINTALRKAVENPDNADAYQLNMARRDEIGQISDSLNMLLTSVSVVYQDELASMKRAIESFDFGIMQFDEADRLIAANPAAIKQFGQADFEALRKMNRNCAQPLGSRGTKPIPLVDLLGETIDPMLVTLHTDTGFFTAMAFCAIVRRPDGAPMHRFVATVAMDGILHDSRQAMNAAQKAKIAQQRASIEAQEMRRLLESCLCLMEPPRKDPANFDQGFLPDRILNDWYHEALRDELVTGALEHGLLPPLSGDRVAIRNVLRQAMLLVYAQTVAQRPVLKVDARKLNDGKVEMTILDISDQRPNIGPAMRTKTVDATLPSAALRTALTRAGGSFVSMSSEGGAARVTFTLNQAQTSIMPTQMLLTKAS